MSTEVDLTLDEPTAIDLALEQPPAVELAIDQPTPVEITISPGSPSEQPVDLIVQQPAAVEVTLSQVGAQGPPGPAGPDGTQVYSFDVPAVLSWSISHMLGRYPLGATFYDVAGNEVEVGLQMTDLNTLVVLQESPIEGKVVFG